MRLPTILDRYPAKMVSKLADRLIDAYASRAEHIVDPFCGSGAVLVAAQRRLIRATGVDINPVAGLLCETKLRGFDAEGASALAAEWVAKARRSTRRLPVQWDGADYWFTAATIAKYERLRATATGLRLVESNEGRAVLLSYALSVRLCSRADQRSPKPFISAEAVRHRAGKHFDPYKVLPDILQGVSRLHAGKRASLGQFQLADVSARPAARLGLQCSHIVTSPPYINAQDYFRNFKLELHLLEGMLSFSVDEIKERFIGTERGDLASWVSAKEVREHCDMLPKLRMLRTTHPRLASVVHRYVHDMGNAFDQCHAMLQSGGTCVVVCGDNLLGGQRISTWRVLDRLLVERGFVLRDRFRDAIQDRLLPPKRSGHKGLIKEEVVSAYTLRKVSLPRRHEIGTVGPRVEGLGR